VQGCRLGHWELSDEFKTIKFYQADVRKQAMISRALSNTELPVVVFIKEGTDFLTQTTDYHR
jgi:thioredoxin 1